ncbi:hypothetical protein ABW19_dt0202653 [Dactylella cylindrospora]|nr:hypothetical protein ABW19_dt0202653 [Dactylella cylindrospora]
MDPITTIGLAASTLTIVEAITKSINKLVELRERWEEADSSVSRLIGLLISIKAALRQISEWANLEAEDSSNGLLADGQLQSDLSISLSCCRLSVATVDRFLEGLDWSEKNALTFCAKAAKLMGDSKLKEYVSDLMNQTGALNFLLQALQCKSGSTLRRFLRSEETRKVLDSAKETSSSLIWAGDAPSIKALEDSMSTLSIKFDFDTEIFHSQVYRNAIKSSWRKESDRGVYGEPTVSLAIQDFMIAESFKSLQDGHRPLVHRARPLWGITFRKRITDPDRESNESIETASLGAFSVMRLQSFEDACQILRVLLHNTPAVNWRPGVRWFLMTMSIYSHKDHRLLYKFTPKDIILISALFEDEDVQRTLFEILHIEHRLVDKDLVELFINAIKSRLDTNCKRIEAQQELERSTFSWRKPCTAENCSCVNFTQLSRCQLWDRKFDHMHMSLDFLTFTYKGTKQSRDITNQRYYGKASRKGLSHIPDQLLDVLTFLRFICRDPRGDSLGQGLVIQLENLDEWLVGTRHLETAMADLAALFVAAIQGSGRFNRLMIAVDVAASIRSWGGKFDYCCSECLVTKIKALKSRFSGQNDDRGTCPYGNSRDRHPIQLGFQVKGLCLERWRASTMFKNRDLRYPDLVGLCGCA